MKIVTINVNGLINAADRGFLHWLEHSDVDVVCIQDLRIKEKDIPESLLEVPGYFGFFFDADDPEMGGVGIYTREMPKAIIRGLGVPQVDMEGRFLQADFDRFSVCSVLFPRATDEDEQELKFQFMDAFGNHLKKTRRKRREFIFAGTFHIAHRTIDLGNWQEYQRTSGFLPEERAWMDQMLGPMGYIDAFRLINRKDRQHTWWPYDEAQRNGQRLDYQILTPNLADYVFDARIITEPRISPHCMVEVEYDFD
ncbi:exodeoxyribonuclease III [Natronospirillum operosum]|uniref:Exodeoxyribonuclease III n=1 Tax=Natronospirillum operosum TaxID=2759953 RepID=A0A4Z0W803_9GAMM|nr:exodeoxyribonuclease III [Natronospirillum operosum]TGG91759.1 exodeoxyribonuclease III [Natronospirillum operosum]